VNFGDGRKAFERDASLFGEQRHQSRIRLVRGKADCVLPRDVTPSFNFRDDVRHFCDRGARQSFSFEYDLQFPARGILDFDRFCKLSRAAEEKFAESESSLRDWLRGTLYNERG
jgi:hypothetical protein